MSKLNGMQIFELLSSVNDSLILESCAPLITAGGTAAGATATALTKDTVLSTGATASTASAAAKVGFGAWVAKGGWVALVAGAIAAAGIAAGGFYLLDRIDWPSFPDMTEETSQDVPSEDNSSTTRELSDLLSLFSAEQGVLSAGEDGSLVVDAQWGQGDENISTLVFNPREVAQALNQGYTKDPGAVLLKVHRNTAFAATATAYQGTKELGRNENLTLPLYQYSYYSSRYEYIVIQLTDDYQRRSSRELYVEWLGMGTTGLSSDDRSMTVAEIAFYDNVWDAFMATEEKLKADGTPPPALKYTENGLNFARGTLKTPFVYIDPTSLNGTVITEIEGVFSFSIAVQVVILEEGARRLDDRAFSSAESLRAVYLPDSLQKLENDPFAFCPELTYLRIGSGIAYIDRSALPSSLTDIDYNGTMEQWCNVFRQGGADARVLVHCLDGDIPYNATEPVSEYTEASRKDLTWNTPLALAEGQVALDIESTYLTLSNGAGTEKTVLLRWALTELQDPPALGYDSRSIFYFDVLDPVDGSLLYVFDFEESLSYTREEGSSFFLAQGALEDGMPLSATLFLTNYGYSDQKDALSVRTTHFRLELNAQGEFAVSRNADDGLKDDVTVPCPLPGRKEYGQINQVFTNIRHYLGSTYGLGYQRPARLLLVTRPHGDSAIFAHRTAPRIDGGVFSKLETILDAPGFNARSLEYLYEWCGVYKP